MPLSDPPVVLTLDAHNSECPACDEDSIMNFNIMHGGHQNLNRDRFGYRSGVGGVWRCHDEGAVAPAARMQTVFWKRMDIDVVRSCSERVCSGFDVRLMVIQNVSTGRDEVCVWSMWGTWSICVV